MLVDQCNQNQCNIFLDDHLDPQKPAKADRELDFSAGLSSQCILTIHFAEQILFSVVSDISRNCLQQASFSYCGIIYKCVLIELVPV